MSEYSDRIIEIQNDYYVDLAEARKMAAKEFYLSEISRAKFLKSQGMHDEAFDTILSVLIYTVTK